MNNRDRDITDVLVVGAGPAGLTLACDLQRRGVACRVIDRAPAFHTMSRGKGIQARTLEVLADLGVVDQVLAAGWSRDIRVRWHVGGKLLADLHLPGRDPLPDVPYPNLVLLPQWRTEQALRERLQDLGGSVEQGWELEGLEQDDDEVTANVRDLASGRRHTLRSRYLVGCDGGHSRVREALGLAFRGDSHEEHFVFGDVQIDGLDPDSAYVWFDAERYLAASPFPNQRAWQVQASVRPDAQGNLERASLELFQRLFLERAGRADVWLSNATWLSNFVSNVRMVDRYRVGRVFLAGDAAHVHSPAGGQGMNTGMQDAYNLGWKLGLVLRGTSGDSLLDTYEEERLPVARAVLKGTDVGYVAVFSSNPVITFLRERALVPLLRLPRVQQAILGASDQLDVNYRGRSLAQDTRPAIPGLGSRLGENTGKLGPVDWVRLVTGLRAGDRAPDAEFSDPVTGTRTRLFDHLRGPHFTLLMFAGSAPTPGRLQGMEALADRVGQLFGLDVRPRIVCSRPYRPEQLSAARVVLPDPQGRAHRAYGATGGALYVIRPDGCVGMGAQPLSEAEVISYLSSILTQAPNPPAGSASDPVPVRGRPPLAPRDEVGPAADPPGASG